MSLITSRNGPSNVGGISKGIRGEITGVVGSSPTHRTNLPATMTPSWLAKDMIALADISSHHSILEPSAGTGAIVVELEKRYGCGTVLALELNKECYKQLAIVTECGKINADFLKYQFEYVFDRVVMNPPHRRCVEHVVKAASLLTDRGRLVALIHATYADEIAKHLRDVRFYYLPRETFVLEGNYVEACIAVFDKGDLDV